MSDITRQDIEHLKWVRDELSRQIKALEKKLKPRNGTMAGVKEMTPRIPIKHYIETWMELYERQHGNSGITLLAEKAHLARPTIKQILENDEQKLIHMSTADKLLQAMNLTHVIQDLEIIEVPVRVPIPEPPVSLYEED